jgi:hypothetical protein
MKPYGFNRRDKLTCKYGCCYYLPGVQHGHLGERNRRRARKVARREAKASIQEVVRLLSCP